MAKVKKKQQQAFQFFSPLLQCCSIFCGQITFEAFHKQPWYLGEGKFLYFCQNITARIVWKFLRHCAFSRKKSNQSFVIEFVVLKLSFNKQFWIHHLNFTCAIKILLYAFPYKENRDSATWGCRRCIHPIPLHILFSITLRSNSLDFWDFFIPTPYY